MNKTIIITITSIILTGCVKKTQIVPQKLQAEGTKQYLALETLSDSDIGTVFKRCNEMVDGKKVDAGWISTTDHIFTPNIDASNRTIVLDSTISEKDTRKATYITEITAQGGFIPFVSSESGVSKAYRYFAKIDRVIVFDSTTFRYNPDTVAKLRESDPKGECKYNYIKALHIGNVTVESMEKVNLKTEAQVQAAFSISGNFYQTSEELTNKTGVVLYELAPFSVPAQSASTGVNLNGTEVTPLTPRQMIRVRSLGRE